MKKAGSGMQVNYLGSACMGIKHPALEGEDLPRFGLSRFPVEMCNEAGATGLLLVEQKSAT